MTNKLHQHLYNYELSIFYCVICVVFSFIVLFPFWLQDYIPMILSVPFHPTFFMFGSYCLNYSNKNVFYETLHMIFSLMSIGNLIFFIVEYYSASSSCERYIGEYCYPSAYGCSQAKTIVNVTYKLTSEAETEGYCSQVPFDVIVVCVFIFLAFSVINFFLSIQSICNHCDHRTKDAEEKAKKEKEKNKNHSGEISKDPEDLCDSCTSKRSLHILSLSIISSIIFFLCFAQWVLSLYVYTISVVILNPVYYNSLLAAFICMPLLYVPRPGKLSAKVKVSKDIHTMSSEYNNLLPTDSEENYLNTVPVSRGTKILLIVYTFVVAMALFFSIVQISTQSIWVYQNGGVVDNVYKLRTMVDNALYFNFTNVEKIQYLPNSAVMDDLQNIAFADFTYIFAVIDIVNIFALLALFIDICFYVSRIMSIEVVFT